MIRMIDDESTKCFGEDVALEDYDISETVEFYVKMGAPDKEVMDAYKEKWGVIHE